MTQPTTPPAGEPPADPPATPEPPPADPPKDEPLGDPGKKALDQERTARKAAEKERADLAARLKELEDRDKTEAQKLADRAAEAEKTAAAKDAELLRLRTALKHGISDEDAETFLTATTEDGLTRQAERLAALRGTAPRTPAPDPTQGARGPIDIDVQIREAETKGDVRTAIRLKNQKLLASQNTR